MDVVDSVTDVAAADVAVIVDAAAADDGLGIEPGPLINAIVDIDVGVSADIVDDAVCWCCCLLSLFHYQGHLTECHRPGG